MRRKQITIQDIAKAAGVSKTTVSRYLNGKFDFMSQDTKQNIANIIAETGYRPNRVANSLKTNRSGLIGVVMSNVMSTQTPQLLASICDACARHEKKIIVVNSEKDPEKERSLVYDLLDQKVDGLLVISGYNVDFYQQLDREELPVVLADRVPRDIDIDSVSINHAESTRRMITHLVTQGYEHIILLKKAHHSLNNTVDIRARAAVKTCRELFGNEDHCQIVELRNSDFEENMALRFQDVTDILKKWFEESKKKPVAIFIAEVSIMNVVACGYYRAGIEISKNFTIAGYSEWNTGGAMIAAPISTIEQPLERMGQLATERLIQRIEQKDDTGSGVREANYLSCRITLTDISE